MALIYTNIQHEFRKRNKLSLNEYVLCDMVFHLCKDSSSKVQGWCYMTKENMGLEMSLSKQSVITLGNKMVELGFLEKQDFTGFLKTTKKWENVYFTHGKESLPSVQNIGLFGKESLPHDGKESLLYNNTLDNNIDKDKKRLLLFSKCIYSDYATLRNTLKDDSEFVKNFASVDLKHYIFSVDAWSESKQTKRTERGWLMTLRKWMLDAKNENKLVKIAADPNKPKGHTNH